MWLGFIDVNNFAKVLLNPSIQSEVRPRTNINLANFDSYPLRLATPFMVLIIFFRVPLSLIDNHMSAKLFEYL